jgi:hypothetical protein
MACIPAVKKVWKMEDSGFHDLLADLFIKGDDRSVDHQYVLNIEYYGPPYFGIE